MHEPYAMCCSPEDWARAKEEMGRLSPEEMARQAQAASATLNAQQTYAFNVRAARWLSA